MYHIATEPGVKMVTKLFSLVPRCDLKYLALCRDFVGYASKSEAYVLRVGLRPTGIGDLADGAAAAAGTRHGDRDGRGGDWEDHPRCVKFTHTHTHTHTHTQCPHIERYCVRCRHHFGLDPYA